MTNDRNTERIEKLMYADLYYKPYVGEEYGEASERRMSELKALLLKSMKEE